MDKKGKDRGKANKTQDTLGINHFMSIVIGLLFIIIFNSLKNII